MKAKPATYQLGENPEIDKICRESPNFHDFIAELYFTHPILTMEQALFYVERFTNENVFSNSALSKAMREEDDE